MTIAGEKGLYRSLDRAREQHQREIREQEHAQDRERARQEEAKKRALTESLSIRTSYIVSGIRAQSGLYPYLEPGRERRTMFGGIEDGRDYWESEWRPIGSRPQGILMAMLRQELVVKTHSGTQGYDYFSYQHRRRVTSVLIRLDAGDVSSDPLTSLTFENSAIDGSWGDVNGFVYPQIPLYGKDRTSVEGRQAKQLLDNVEIAFGLNASPSTS